MFPPREVSVARILLCTLSTKWIGILEYFPGNGITALEKTILWQTLNMGASTEKGQKWKTHKLN